MDDLLTIFVVIFMCAAGVPIPAVPVLLLAGAEAVTSPAIGILSLAAASSASLLGSTVWYISGRKLGRRVLSLLCQISISPDTCVRKNELSLAKRGALTLVVANFVPGLSILAPPLAGALGVPLGRFMLFNGIGSLLWASAGMLAGVLFHEEIHWLLDTLKHLGGTAVIAAAGLLSLYVLWRWLERRRAARDLAEFGRIESGELALLMARGDSPVIVDVRSLASRADPTSRLPGALNIDLMSLEEASFSAWPDATEVITYCDCPNDVTAVKAAQLLVKRGRRARVLSGGIDNWTKSGYPAETHKVEAAA